MAKKVETIIIFVREIIAKSRKNAHRPTKVHKNPKAYNRAREKRAQKEE